MTELVINHPREDTKTVVKASVETMSSVDSYADQGQRIVAKQEASVMGGNGARLIIDVPEMQAQNDRTVIDVTAEKEVAIDMATDAEDIKSEFLSVINDLREWEIDELLEEMSRRVSPEASKEVASSREFGDTQSTMGARFILIFVVMTVFTLLFGLMMTAAMMP